MDQGGSINIYTEYKEAEMSLKRLVIYFETLRELFVLNLWI